VHREAQANGGQIVGITPEKQNYASRLKEWADVQFPILTDMDNGYALSLGLAVWVGTEISRYRAAGVDLSAYQGNDAWTVPIPATFVVGADGIIRSRYLDPDYRRRMATEELLQALKAAC
jgi:peroxiredoxin